MKLPPQLDRPTRRLVDKVFRPHGTVDQQWCRLEMNEDIASVIASLPPGDCDAAEISGDRHRGHPWRSYTRLAYPEFDLCSSVAEYSFDAVICEQVLEHVRDPWLGARTLHALCRPGGHVIVSTPFLIRVHNEPEDFWRFTVSGLRLLLEQAHLEVVTVKSWGNRSCVRANFRHWVARRPWQSMENEELFPIVVWAVARRPVVESSDLGPGPIRRPGSAEDEGWPGDS